MFLCCQPQWERFSRPLSTDLLSCFLPDSPVQLASAPLPCQLLLERERTPGTAGFDLRGPQPQQQQVGHHRYRHRALHSSGILRHLRLAQAHDTLEFFDTEFDRPSAQIAGHAQVSCCLRQIGREPFGVFGAVVTPPATHHDCDLSHVRHLCLLSKRPEDPAPGVGGNQGNTDLTVVQGSANGSPHRADIGR